MVREMDVKRKVIKERLEIMRNCMKEKKVFRWNFDCYKRLVGAIFFRVYVAA